MIRIAICDDEKVYCDLVYNDISRIINNNSVCANIIKYQDPKLLITEHKIHNFDILFLDIDMPEVSGFDLSRMVRESSSQTYIIFISAKHELVYNSFEYNPFYFICKTNPNTLYKDLEHVLNKLLLYYQQNRKIAINDVTQGKVIVKLQDILYMKSDRHYLEYYILNRNLPYLTRNTLNDALKELSCPDFVKVHQRYLVNMNHITKFDVFTNIVIIGNNEEIPISKTYKDEAAHLFMVYKRR